MCFHNNSWHHYDLHRLNYPGNMCGMDIFLLR
jgi:hypothetical protein